MSHGHSHGHGHGHGNAKGGLTMQNVAKFYLIILASSFASTLCFWVFFSFDSWAKTLIYYIIWETVIFFFLGSSLRIPKSKMSNFGALFGLSVFSCFIMSLLFVSPPILDASNLPFGGERIVHFDFKGAPLTPSYLEKLFPVLRRWGATGILIEWEDTLPYHGRLESLRSDRHVYTELEVKKIVEDAKAAGLRVIPLVQTLGHLEYVLKRSSFKHLRADASKDNVINPADNESIELIKEIIDQTLSFHPKNSIKQIHIGGDQVGDLTKGEKSSEELFVSHLIPIIKHVKSSVTTVMMWDDMLRKWSDEYKKLSGLVEPVIWSYSPNIAKSLPKNLWIRYAENFPAKTMWAASVFKGADTVQTVFPPIQKYVDNVESWLQMEKAVDQEFKGMILTGWSRYHHKAPLCELLPAGLPSLAVELAVLIQGNYTQDLRKEVLTNTLGLTDFPLEPDVELARGSFQDTGNFPGSRAFKLIAEVEYLRLDGSKLTDEKVDNLKDSLRKELKNIIYNPDIEEFVTKVDRYLRM